MITRTIILDFDGTLVESVGIKDKAFRELFSDYPEHLDEIMAYHLAHNATVRFIKFKHITEHILGETYTPRREKELSERFSQLVFKQIVDCSFVPGALDFLDYFYGKMSLYLVSISPAEEFNAILKARDLKKYFKDIYAVPWVKVDAINDILIKENITPGEAMFIGDSQEDYDSALAAGVFFIGRDSKKSFSEKNMVLCADMLQVKKYILDH